MGQILKSREREGERERASIKSMGQILKSREREREGEREREPL